MFETAGRAGVDPGPYKLRELCQMADGRSKAEWDQTAVLACALYNAIRDPKRKRQPFTIADFHPFETRQKKPGVRLAKRNRRILRGMFDAAAGGGF